jgi:hypothetical protein
MALLEGIEEQRQLSTMEKNFKSILEAHKRKILEAKRIYCKNRAKIRWAQLGDENIKFFHTVATQSFRKKSYLFFDCRGWFYCQ